MHTVIYKIEIIQASFHDIGHYPVAYKSCIAEPNQEHDKRARSVYLSNLALFKVVLMLFNNELYKSRALKSYCRDSIGLC